ncbi:hypothetical protein [Ramlibacter alkalitolerans]|uniref:Uncharacterized protein n=1 Tax=Ramlibacter alkalitolerans TaxID=2039631 RepID=A0ABS1JUF7_9BURK|nr:hypothetical protein [Ramlibacter alkalitolerans]MBL0427859.1 hypothetical protein [Ramlibacter alkalitolerans]
MTATRTTFLPSRAVAIALLVPLLLPALRALVVSALGHIPALSPEHVFALKHLVSLGLACAGVSLAVLWPAKA